MRTRNARRRIGAHSASSGKLTGTIHLVASRDLSSALGPRVLRPGLAPDAGRSTHPSLVLLTLLPWHPVTHPR